MEFCWQRRGLPPGSKLGQNVVDTPSLRAHKLGNHTFLAAQAFPQACHKLGSGSAQANLRFAHIQVRLRQQLIRSKDGNGNSSCQDSDIEYPVIVSQGNRKIERDMLSYPAQKQVICKCGDKNPRNIITSLVYYRNLAVYVRRSPLLANPTLFAVCATPAPRRLTRKPTGKERSLRYVRCLL